MSRNRKVKVFYNLFSRLVSEPSDTFLSYFFFFFFSESNDHEQGDFGSHLQGYAEWIAEFSGVVVSTRSCVMFLGDLKAKPPSAFAHFTAVLMGLVQEKLIVV